MTKNPIEIAVAPLKEDAIVRAAKEARETVERVRKELADANNDMEIAAPWPNYRECSDFMYQKKMQRHYLFSSLIKSHEATHRPGTPYYVDVDAAKVERFIEDAKKDAAAQYDAFVSKLVRKIGATTEASLTGNHVWGYFYLDVTKADGTKETWKTQQIVNVSKLGKFFNQWPSRKLKNRG